MLKNNKRKWNPNIKITKGINSQFKLLRFYDMHLLAIKLAQYE